MPIDTLSYLNSENLMTTTTYMNPEAYFATRRKDYHDLLADISESKGNLGYCEISGNTLTIKGEIHAFDSNAEAKMQILRRFW